MRLLEALKGKNLANWGIALDIGTEFVKALIFETRDSKGIVKGVGRARQRLADMQAGSVTDIHGVIGNCEKALEQAAKQASFLPKQVIVGIAGELVKGATTTVAYKRPDPRISITVDELKTIIVQVQKQAFDKARKILSEETGHNEIDVRLVNAAVVDVRIDGYKVTNPLGFKGSSVEVGIFNAFAPIVHLGALQTIAQELELDLLSVAAEPYAVARSLEDEESVDFSAIFIDVGGGTTDIAVVKSGGLVGTRMFALGGRAFTKRLAQIFGVPFSQAEEMKLAFSAGKLAKTKHEQVSRALELDLTVWLDGVELMLADFGEDDLLPSKIYLVGGGSALPDLGAGLEKSSWHKQLPFARKPQIHFIQPNEVSGVIDQTETLKAPFDITPMALANLGIELVGQAGVVDTIMTKIIGTLRI